MKKTHKGQEIVSRIVLGLIILAGSNLAYPQGGTWTTKASMSVARNDLTAGSVNGVLYALGGKIANNCSALTTVEAYDPLTDTWTTKAPMPIARYGPRAVGIGGLLYVVGGDNNCSGAGFSELDAFNPAINSWSTLSPAPTQLAGVAAASLNGVLYVFCDPGTVQAYDPSTNAWTTKAPMPTPYPVPSYSIAGGINGVLYVVGPPSSGGSTEMVAAYDPATNTWTSKTTVVPARTGASGGVLNGILYLIGGNDQTGQVTRVDAYDPACDTWTSDAPTLTARTRFAVGIANGVLFAMGGGPDNGVVATNEAFTPAVSQGGTWTTKRPMPTARAALAVGTINNVIYAVGGGNSCCGNNLSTVEAYDPTTDTWTTKASMQQPRDELSVAVVNGIMYAIGGWQSPNQLATVEAYDPSTNSWTFKAPMPEARTTMGAGVVNGILYAVGGYDRYGVGPVSRVDAYDPSTDTWTPKSPMPTTRSYMGIGVINGILYAVGGGNNTGIFASMVAYDPLTDTWTTKASMPTARYGFATAVINGILYAVGGINNSGALNTVEAYDPVADHWTSFAVMPTARGNFSGDVANGILYAVGGGNGNAPLATNEAFAPTPPTGNIAGIVSTQSTGIAGVTVELLDANGLPLSGFPPLLTGSQGAFQFSNLPPASYQIMIVEPLGYAADQNPKSATVCSAGTTTVNFALSEVVLADAARGMGYWKHQFDVYLTGKGSAQETQAQLNADILNVQSHYTPHFSIFAGTQTYLDWQKVLSSSAKASMFIRAEEQLAALVLNVASLKIGQYTVVSADSRTAGDVLTYVSDLLTDNDSSNDELAKNLAEMVNNQQTIGAGIVPTGAILYKGAVNPGHIIWGFDRPTTYALYNNYPNPFNPSTTIQFDLPKEGFVSLKVYNSLGQEVTSLINEERAAGRYTVRFDASQMASGVYFYRLSVGSFVSTRKMILLK